MPNRPRKPCGEPGCPKLIAPHLRKCKTHQSQYTRRRDAKVRATQPWRDYDSPAYRSLRRRVLEEEPKCRLQISCAGAPSTEADHIVPLSEGGVTERTNLQGACGRCNRAKAAASRRRRGGRG